MIGSTYGLSNSLRQNVMIKVEDLRMGIKIQRFYVDLIVIYINS